MTEKILAWHFVGDTLRDGQPIPEDNVTLSHKGKVFICASGLHASRRLIDALQYAPGATICRVECWGDVEEHNDKLVARNRKILWRVDGEQLLRKFARLQALSVVDKWDAPEVVIKWLKTGDEQYRKDANSAAWSAARSAANSAANSAARSAVYSAAYSGAYSTAWCAAESAARYAARSVRYDHRYAAYSAANEMFTEMVEKESSR